MDEITGVDCIIKAHDPSLKHNLRKIHGYQVAKEHGLGEEHPMAQTALPLGVDPLESVGALYRMLAAWSPSDRQALGRIQIDFHRG